MADDEAEAKLSDVERRIDTLNARSEAYKAEALEQAGTFVFLVYYGRLAIERGFVKPGEGEAAGDENEDGGGLPSASGAAKPKARSTSHSAALIEDLSAHKTAALCIELANNPDVALVAVVHAMLLLEQPQDMVLMLLALGAAHSVNAVEKKFTDRKEGH